MEMPKLSRPQTRDPQATAEDIRAWYSEWAEYEIVTGKTRDDVLRDKHTIAVHEKRDTPKKRENWGDNPPTTLEAPYFRCPMCPEYRDIHAGGMMSAGNHLDTAHVGEPRVGDVEFFSLPDSSVDPHVYRNLTEAETLGSWDRYESEAA
jgi:hypothetical protein